VACALATAADPTPDSWCCDGRGDCWCGWWPAAASVLYASAEDADAMLPTLNEVAFAKAWILATSALLLTLLARTTSSPRRSERKSADVATLSSKSALRRPDMTVDISCSAVDICCSAGPHGHGALTEGDLPPGLGFVIDGEAAAAAAAAVAAAVVAAMTDAAEANVAAGAVEEDGGPVISAAANCPADGGWTWAAWRRAAATHRRATTRARADAAAASVAAASPGAVGGRLVDGRLGAGARDVRRLSPDGSRATASSIWEKSLLLSSRRGLGVVGGGAAAPRSGCSGAADRAPPTAATAGDHRAPIDSRGTAATPPVLQVGAPDWFVPAAVAAPASARGEGAAAAAKAAAVILAGGSALVDRASADGSCRRVGVVATWEIGCRGFSGGPRPAANSAGYGGNKLCSKGQEATCDAGAGNCDAGTFQLNAAVAGRGAKNGELASRVKWGGTVGERLPPSRPSSASMLLQDTQSLRKNDRGGPKKQ